MSRCYTDLAEKLHTGVLCDRNEIRRDTGVILDTNDPGHSLSTRRRSWCKFTDKLQKAGKPYNKSDRMNAM